MSAKKRQDGRYQKKVRISRPTEPPRYKYIYGSTIREVEQKKAELMAQVAAGIDLENDPTVSFAIDRWLAEREIHVRPQTLLNYRNSLKHIKDAIGDTRVRDVTVSDARRIYAKMVKDIPVQAGRAVRFAASVFADEIDRGTIAKNPFKAVRLKKREAPTKRALTPEELDKIDRAPLSPFCRALVSLLRYTGMRRGEAIALTVDDIDFERNEIHITKTVTTLGTINPPKTKAGVRTVPMPPQLAEDLRAYIYTQHSGTGYLFTTVHKTPISSGTFEGRWRVIAQQIFGDDVPEDFTAHIFRHTYAHDLVTHNVPLTTAMLLLGHDSIKTTMGVYAHFGYKDADTSAVLEIYKRVSDRASSN